MVLRVRDTGIGIAPEMLPRIFDLFVQEGQALDRSQGGLGLGLAIVRSLVQLHGGHVTAHSDGQGLGAEFVVHLPHVAAHVAPEALADDAAAAATQPAAVAMRVLIVDDNEDGAAMLGELLRAYGYDVRTAHDGPSALELAETFRPTLALLDIGLPVMDGYEVARRFRTTPALQATRLIAVTGYGQEQDRQRSAAVGFEAHLVKPLDLDLLRHVLESAAATATDRHPGGGDPAEPSPAV